METTFRLNANDLDSNFLEALRKLFVGKEIVVNVTSEMDTTEYLLSDPERKARLMKSIEQDRAGQRIAVNLDDYLEK